ncbi:UNVERIFIED_ORG: hypothetical protein DFS12_10431 [Chitinophaga ginsengisegetis]|nr:hypothetical protein [Chitinophaga ginsengisegetis]MDR6647972.1 hypothetical protein [Chitinophaga ginsengisegetis]MDR6654878.1 hypothetical protein [Chitinophaga ginsengisegetis]
MKIFPVRMPVRYLSLSFFRCSLSIPSVAIAQTDTSMGTFWHPKPRNYEVKQAVENESLVPMFSYVIHLGVRLWRKY